jgi:hypothetical protein
MLSPVLVAGPCPRSFVNVPGYWQSLEALFSANLSIAMGQRLKVGALLLAMAAVTASARAQNVPGEVPLADVLEILVVDRELLAIDAAGGGQTVARLRLNEAVLWKGARGKVGVIITDQRILAVATQSGSWQETDYGRTEQRPESALLGERVALVVTSERVLGFNGGSGNLAEYRLGPREQVVVARAGENVGVVVTDRKALGLSPFLGGFFAIPLNLGDQIEAVTAESNLATLTAGRRVLIFRATTGSWEERTRDLH